MTPSSSFASYPLESLNSVPSSPSSTSLPTTTAFSGPGSNPKPFPTLPYSAATDSLQPNHSALPDMSSDLQTRELAFAAKQYSSCCTASPDDSNYDMLYNHGLVLQELAARLIPGSTEQVVMLQEVSQRQMSQRQMRCTGLAFSLFLDVTKVNFGAKTFTDKRMFMHACSDCESRGST